MSVLIHRVSGDLSGSSDSERIVLGVVVVVMAVTVGLLVSIRPAFGALVLVGLVPVFIALHVRYAVYLLALSVGVNVTMVDTPVHVSLPQLISLIVILAVMVRVTFRDLPATTDMRVWSWSGMLFAVAALPSLIATAVPSIAIIGFVQILLVGAVIFAATKVATAGPGLVDRTLEVLALGAVISAFPAFVQIALQIGPDSFMRFGFMRAHSTYGQPNSYGVFLAGMVPLFFSLSAYRKRFIVPCVITALALVATLSRGGIAAACLAVVTFLVIRRGTATSSGAGFPVVIGIGLMASALLLLPAPVISGLTDFGDWSSQQRFLTLLVSFAAIRARPFLGYGSGSFAWLRPDIAVPGLVDDVEMPHNFIVEVWLELGLLAMVCFVALMICYYVATMRAYRRQPDPVLAALVAAITGMMAASLTSSLLIRGIEETFALLIALTAARLVWLRRVREYANPVPY